MHVSRSVGVYGHGKLSFLCGVNQLQVGAGMRLLKIAVFTFALMDVALPIGQNATGLDRVTVSIQVFMPDGSPPARRLPFKMSSGDGQVSSGDTDVSGGATLTVLPNQGSDYTILFETDHETYSTTMIHFTVEGALLRIPIFLNPPQRDRRARSGSPVVSVTELQKPPEEARSLREKGVRAFAAGDDDGAIVRLERAVSLCPTYTEALNDLGVIFLKMGNLAGAEEVLTRAAKLSPGSDVVRLNLVTVWTRQHRYAEAIETLQKLRLENPNDACVLIPLADALVGQHRLDEAAPLLLEALKSGSLPRATKGEVHYKYGMILIWKHLYPAAVKELSKSVNLLPKNAFAHLELGIAAFRAGQLETAERELQTAYRIGGTEVAVSQLLLGHLYLGQKRNLAARMSLATFLNDNPNAPEAQEVRRILDSIK